MSDLQTHLTRIQNALKAPKGQRNSFANFNYRSCEDILEAVKPLLAPCTLTLADHVEHIGDRYYIVATATLHLGTEKIEITGQAREAEEKKGMDSAQISGATSSYARKYALNGIFLIDDSKDSDQQGDSSKPASAKTEPEKPISDDQREEIEFLGGRLPDSVLSAGVRWASGGRTSKIDELSFAEAGKLLPFLKKKVEKNENP